MSKAVFGPGALYITRTDLANQPTVNIGYAQEFSIDESGDLVENYGTNQYAIDIARGTIKATGKAKAARVSGIALNAVFHGEVLTAGSLGATTFPGEVATLSAAPTTTASVAAASGATQVTVTSPAGLVVGQVITGTNIPAGTSISAIAGSVLTLSQALTGTGVASGATLTFGPINTVANGATFNQDLGVVSNTSGLPLLTAGSGTPAAAGQYSVNSTTGQYFFHPGDAGKVIATMYAYTQAAVGQTKIVLNHQLGYTPTFQIDYATVFQGALMYVRVFKAVATKLTRQFKLKDFSAPEIDFGIAANAANQIYQETYPEVS
jgi:hypothetical protein